MESISKVQEDPDIQRATDLVELHYGVKMNHMQDENLGLKQARGNVSRVLEKLERAQRRENRIGGRQG